MATREPIDVESGSSWKEKLIAYTLMGMVGLLIAFAILAIWDHKNVSWLDWVFPGGMLVLAGLLIALILAAYYVRWQVLSAIILISLIALLVLDGSGLAWGDKWWLWTEDHNPTVAVTQPIVGPVQLTPASVQPTSGEATPTVQPTKSTTQPTVSLAQTTTTVGTQTVETPVASTTEPTLAPTAASTQQPTVQPDAKSAPAEQTTAPDETTAPVTVSGANNSQCWFDQAVTANQDSGGNRERIEIGGGGRQIVVYYPHEGVAAIAYIIGPRETPADWWGFGYILQAVGNCDSYDFVGNTPEQLKKLSVGWSGIIIDLRGDAPVVTNMGSLSDQEVNDLIAEHKAGMQK